MTAPGPYSGGCQCGAVRFTVAKLGRASLCHCRMCQKAFGGIGGALVTVEGLSWTRGAPSRFASSNKAQRGFCAACGTPLTYEAPDGVALAIGAFDHPEELAPAVQWGTEAKLPYVDDVPGLPGHGTLDDQDAASFIVHIVSYQHPDHDTETWPPEQAS